MNRLPTLGTQLVLLMLTAMAAFCALPAVAAQADEVSVKLVGKAKSGAPVKLLVSGMWPVACTPELDDARLENHDLRVRLRVDASNCLPKPTAFTLLVEHPALNWPVANVLRMHLERADAKGEIRLIGFRLIEIDSPERVVPETGFWWNERGGEFDTAGPGQSILIEPQGDRLGVAVMGYGDDLSSAWFFGAGPLQHRSSEVRLLTLNGGSGPLRDYRQPDIASPAATVWLEFQSSSRAVAWFVVAEPHGGVTLRPQSLVRFRFGDTAPQAWEGLWIIESKDGLLRAADFALADSGDEGFVLIDSANQLWLDCSLQADKPNSPPRRCDLLGTDDEALGQFDDVGLGRMHGKDRGGNIMSAVRIPRP
jgi:hypothetical protein